MRSGPAFSVSNIAWPAEVEADAVARARDLGFAGIELAPSKIFGPWPEIDLSAVATYRRRLAAWDLAIPSLQAILFGRPECKLFGDHDEREGLRQHLERVARIAGALGARACVFGSPRQRDPGDLAEDDAMNLAAEFFRNLAPAFEREGAVLAFEANAAQYGCKFVTHTRQAIDLVRRVDHPGFGLQLDLGTMTQNDEPLEVIGEALPHVAHVHVSEPALAPVGALGTDHARYGEALAAGGWSGWISVEMSAVDDWSGSLARARQVLDTCYAARSAAS